MVPAWVAAGGRYLQPIVGVAAATVLLGDRQSTGVAFMMGVLLALAGLPITLSRL